MVKLVLVSLLLGSFVQNSYAFLPYNPAKATDNKQYCFFASYKVLTTYTWGNASAGASNSSSATKGSSNSTSTSILNPSATGSASTNSSRNGNSTVLVKRADAAPKKSPTTMCNTPSLVQSLYASLLHYCPEPELFEAGLHYWDLQCQYLNVTLNLTSAKAKVTPAYAAALPTINLEKNLTTKAGTLASPAMLDAEFYHRAYKSYFIAGTLRAKNMAYGWGLLGFWGGVLAIGIVVNVISQITAWHNAKTANRKKTPFSPVITMIRTHIVIPAAFGSWSYHRRLFYWITIPKRLDSIIIGAWWVFVIILSFVDYEVFHGNTNFPNVALQAYRYAGDRTGTFGLICLPLIWFFGLRNNPFLWATNISYHSFSLYHRHVAWTCVAEVTVHAIAYTARYKHFDHTYQKNLVQNFFYMGILSLCAMAVMIISSHAWLRSKSYELFLITHILMAILTVYSLFMHIHIKNKQYMPYFWPIIAVWSFDRFMRIVRLVYCNIRVKTSSKVDSTATSTVTYNSQANVITIEIKSNSILKPGPGQHYHIYQPFALRGWENHPFTLGAYSTGSTKDALASPASPASPSTPNSMNKEFGVTVASITSSSPSPARKSNTLTFYIRPYDGWTNRLRKLCLQSATGSYSPTLLLEGPYGHAPQVRQYDTLLMIVGGTGISAALPHIIEHVAENRKATRLTQLRLVWAVKQRGFVEQLARRELAAALRREDFAAEFYCTSSMSEGSSAEGSEKSSIAEEPREKNGAVVSSVEEMLIHSGRPDIPSIIAEAAREAQASDSTVAVLTCGPAAMADVSREAVHQVLKGGFGGMYYFEEAFGW